MSEPLHKLLSIEKFVSIVAVSLAIFHLITTTFLLVDTIVLVGTDLMVAMVLIFLVRPLTKQLHWYTRVIDIGLCILAVVAGIYILVEMENIAFRVGDPTRWDLILGGIAIILTLDATRRVMGWVLPIIAIGALLYAYFGRYVPGSLAHTGFSLSRIIYHLYTGYEGLYGVVIVVVSSIIFLFVIFGAFIEKSSVGDFILQISSAIAGRRIGGPAKVAVSSSAILASITGAGVANVMATGSFTIPLMKKLGYKPEMAGGIEAAASTGGQFMPPIMGATAFVMTQLAGIPYREIAISGFLPALLYFVGVYSYVHLRAIGLNLGTIPKKDIPSFRKTLREGIHLIIPLLVLTIMIFIGKPLQQAGFFSIISVLAVTTLKKKTRMNWHDILASLETGTKNCLMLISAGACAGIVLGVVSLTGVGLQLSTLMISLSGGSVFLAILLIMLVSLIFGMGLPVVACYIIVVVFAGPALIELGVPILTAHMIVFWYSVDANVTPPVAIAAYAASGIAQSNVMKTSFESWRAAKALYIIPLLMAYTPFLTGTALERIEIFISAGLGIIAITAFMQGCMRIKLSWFSRLSFFVAGGLLLWPDAFFPLRHMVGFLIFVTLYIMQIRCARRTPEYDANTAIEPMD
jgi:TRAP transporter 4TM/12TM fusion protein